MSEQKLELRVGLFVVASCLLLGGFVLILTGSEIAKQKVYYVDFAFSGGLQIGAPVKLSGIKLGKVVKLQLIEHAEGPPAATGHAVGQVGEPVVRATVHLGPTADGLLRRGTRILVGMQGLIGEPYLEVEAAERAEPALPEGTAFRGVDATRAHVMTQQIATILESITGLMGTPSTGKEAGALGLAQDLSQLVRRIDRLVAEREDEFKVMFSNLAHSARNFRILSDSVGTVLTPARMQRVVTDSSAILLAVREELPVILTQAHDTLRTVKIIVDRAEGAMDPQVLENMVGDIQNATTRLDSMTKDGQALLEMVRRGEGTIGGLVQDPQVYDDLKEMMRDLKRHPWKMLWRD